MMLIPLKSRKGAGELHPVFPAYGRKFLEFRRMGRGRERWRSGKGVIVYIWNTCRYKWDVSDPKIISTRMYEYISTAVINKNYISVKLVPIEEKVEAKVNLILQLIEGSLLLANRNLATHVAIRHTIIILFFITAFLLSFDL